ncbi:FidL-like protein [Serratia quinivorans]|uniref:FidL-like protein n=1 Tax=Serratia quinivorans TaxID=137545 RepID=UPI0039825926
MSESHVYRKISKRIKKLVIPLLLILLFAFILLAEYLSHSDYFPETCHILSSQEKILNGRIIQMNSSYTVFKTSPDHGELSFEGQLQDDTVSYHMNRTVKFTLKPLAEKDLYDLTFTSSEKKKDDNTPDALFLEWFPNSDTSMLIKINKVASNAYLLRMQHSSPGICLTTLR